MTELRVTYYPDITQKVDPARVRGAIVAFADALQAELTRVLAKEIRVRVADVLSVPDQYTDLLEGNAHIALMKPVAYVFAHLRDEKILPACVAHRPIDGEVGTTYFGQVYARANLGIRSLEDLAEQPAGTLRMAFGERFSTSNFLVPASMLRGAGIHPFLFFKTIEFAGGHDFAAEAVYEGRADIGAGHDGVIKILGDSQPDAEERLVRLSREFIHSDPVVVHSGVLPDGVSYEIVQTACAAIAKTAPVREALDLFWGWVKDLSPTEDANYQSIRDAIERLDLRETDMLQ